MFYLNTIRQLFLFVEQLDQLEFCLPYSRLVTGIPILPVFQNLRRNSNKTPLCIIQHLFFIRRHYILDILHNYTTTLTNALELLGVNHEQFGVTFPQFCKQFFIDAEIGIEEERIYLPVFCKDI